MTTLPPDFIAWLDAEAARMRADGSLWDDAPPATAWLKMPPVPSDEQMSHVREVETLLDSDPAMTLDRACTRVAADLGVTADTVKKWRANALAHRLVKLRDRKMGKAMTIKPSAKSRATHRRIVGGK